MMLAGWLVGPVRAGLDGRVGRFGSLLAVGARVMVVAMEVERVDEACL